MSQFPMDFNTLYGMYMQRRMMNQPTPLASAYNDQFNRANYNNEVRYGDIIGGRTGIYDRNMERINSLGAQEREDIGRRADQQLAAQRADLTARGLGGTTVRQSIENRNLEDRNRALRQQSDQEVRQRIATDSALADNVYATMERRNDIAPDLGQLAQLSQAAGASGMYGQYPGFGGGYNGPGMGGIYNRQPPAYVPYGGPSSGNGGFGAGARQPVGRPGNRLPGYDNSQGRSIGNMGPGSFQPGGSAYPPTAGGYPLPGGGTSTPTQLPGNMPGFGGDNGNFMQPGMGMPGGVIRSRYPGGDRVQGALESALMSQLRGMNNGQPINRPGGQVGTGQQGSGMIRTAGDISRTPQQQINDYMQKRMRDNVYGINPNPSYRSDVPNFTIGGMPVYAQGQQPIYDFDYVGYPQQQRSVTTMPVTRSKTSTPYQVYGRMRAAQGRTGDVANQVGQYIGQASNMIPGMMQSAAGAVNRAFMGNLPQTANNRESLLQYGPYVA